MFGEAESVEKMLSISLTFVFQVYTVDSISSHLQCGALFSEEAVWTGFQHTNKYLHVLSATAGQD